MVQLGRITRQGAGLGLANLNLARKLLGCVSASGGTKTFMAPFCDTEKPDTTECPSTA